MTSSVKSGFSTINRLLGKKSARDEYPADPHAAMSSRASSDTADRASFSKSMTHLDTSSQYNKIVPLAAMSNAPFEQTFRITVALPRDQLYVVRIGAKTKLHQIMDMTCTAKQLDPLKYEFRHPADNSMVFPNECTIGEVGLNEIRLVPVTERRSAQNNFTSAELGRISNSNGDRQSLANPARNGPKSFYSSTTSLNSMDSAQSRPADQPVPPMRKKRAAPRPPSQIVIPEDSPMKQMNFHVSTPNLSQNLVVSPAKSEEVAPRKVNGGLRPMSMYQAPSSVQGSMGDLSPRGINRTLSNSSEKGPLHVPRRKKAAPAPPPRAKDVGVPQAAPRRSTPSEQQENNSKEI